MCVYTSDRLLHGSLRLASQAVAEKMCDDGRVTTIKRGPHRRVVVDVWRVIILLLSRRYRYYHRHYIMINNKLSSSYSQRSDAREDEWGVNCAGKFFWMYTYATRHIKNANKLQNNNRSTLIRHHETLSMDQAHLKLCRQTYHPYVMMIIY